MLLSCDRPLREEVTRGMTWDESISWLYSLQKRGIKLDLDRVRDCLEAVGRPQDAFPCILVGGTNGKGSTAAALSSILSRPGRRVGLFTSPHLLDFRERIRVDGRMVPGDLLASIVTARRDTWERFELSFFESAFMLAMCSFRDLEADLAVLEVGMGGRLDATNTVEPVISVITSLGLDHTNVLGGTVAAIAGEKAGIFRPGVPAVVAGGAAGASPVLEQRARALGAPLYRRRECLRIESLELLPDGVRFRLKRRAAAPGGFSLPPEGLLLESSLAGRHQAGNLALAALGALLLPERGIAISTGEIAAGIRRVRWPGRLERPRPDLALIADVGHNRPGARTIVSHLATTTGGREIRPVVGMVTHKDHAGFFRELRRVAAGAWIAPVLNERAAPLEDLLAAADAAGFVRHPFSSVSEALKAALSGSHDPDGPLVLLCGSFYALDEGFRSLGVEPSESLWDARDAPLQGG